MSFFDKIKDIMSATDEDDDFDEVETSSKNEQRGKERDSKDDYYSYDGRSSYDRYDREKTTQFPSERKSGKGSQPSFTSGLGKPERFEDATAIADHLADNRTVVLNLEAANRETQRRLIDFLSGAAYAHDGRIKRVANSTFIITPSNVDVMGELLLDELDGSGSYSSSTRY